MKLSALSIALLALTCNLHAEVALAKPWVRATIPAQKATAAFMELTSDDDVKLVSASCDLDATVEIHEMKMDGDVMKMRQVKEIELPSGKIVSLKPGGYHVMLLDLKKPINKDQVVTIKLVFEKKDGSSEIQEVEAKAYPIGETPFTDK